MHAGGRGGAVGGGALSLTHISSDQVLDLRKEIAETEAVAAGNNKQVAAHSHLSCLSHTHTNVCVSAWAHSKEGLHGA